MDWNYWFLACRRLFWLDLALIQTKPSKKSLLELVNDGLSRYSCLFVKLILFCVSIRFFLRWFFQLDLAYFGLT